MRRLSWLSCVRVVAVCQSPSRFNRLEIVRIRDEMVYDRETFDGPSERATSTRAHCS